MNQLQTSDSDHPSWIQASAGTRIAVNYFSGTDTVMWVGYFDANDKHHRTDGPAVTWFSEAGLKTHESWWRHGVPHRENGPVSTRWDRYGNILPEQLISRFDQNVLFFDESGSMRSQDPKDTAKLFESLKKSYEMRSHTPNLILTDKRL